MGLNRRIPSRRRSDRSVTQLSTIGLEHWVSLFLVRVQDLTALSVGVALHAFIPRGLVVEPFVLRLLSNVLDPDIGIAENCSTISVSYRSPSSDSPH